MSLFENYLSRLTSKKLIFLAINLVFLAVGCSTDDVNQPDNLGEFNAKTLVHDNVERDYNVYLPNNFDKGNSNPLVIALHGGGGSADRFEKDVSEGTITAAVESRGVVLVTPDGKDKRWNDGRPEIFGNDPMYDDVGFISSLIDSMIQNYNIDPSRVYVTGISNGGLMSFRLAMDLSNKIAAVAPVTAQVATEIESLVPENPISMMLINGVDDPLVPYDGGCINIVVTNQCSGDILSTDETISKFVGFNQCTNGITTNSVIDNLPNDGTSVEISRYENCNQNTEVVLVKVNGGGHTWPSGAQYLPAIVVGKVSREINASEMILDFFLEHSRN